MSKTVLSLPRHPSHLKSLLSDSLLLLLAFWLAFSLRYDELFWTADSRIWTVLAITHISPLVVFAMLGLYQAFNRGGRVPSMIVVLAGVSISATLMLLIGCSLQAPISRSVPPIYWFLALALVGGSRIIARFIIGHKDTFPEEI